MNIVTFLLLSFSKSLSMAPSAASSFLYPQSAHPPYTALFIADNGVTLVLLPCWRYVLRSCVGVMSCTITISRPRFFWRAVHIDTPQQMGLFSVCSMQTWHVPSLRVEPLVEYDLHSALYDTISTTCDWCWARHIAIHKRR